MMQSTLMNLTGDFSAGKCYYRTVQVTTKRIVLDMEGDNLGIWQAIDIAGEQTFMKSRKTAGAITTFASPPETV